MTSGMMLALGLVAVVGAILFTFFRWIGRSEKEARREARAAALQGGVTIDVLEREVPIFRGHSDRFSHLERHRCTRYSVVRRDPKGCARWSFLQRDHAAGAQYPNGWLYQSLAGSPTPRLHAVLLQIASEWTEELLEFEADSDTLSAYWQEWGGAETATRVVTWLRAVDDASAAA